MLDILFVVTHAARKNRSRTRVLRQFAAGVGYLAALMLENGFTCDVLDFDLEGVGVDALVADLKTLRPRVVGFSALTEGIESACALAGVVRAVAPGTLTVLGGPHGTFLGDELVEQGAFDVVVRGEAEASLPQLMAALTIRGGDLEGVPGVSHRRGGTLAVHDAAPLLSDLDELPLPRRELFTSRQYARAGIISARGCPYSCIFCNAQALSGRRYRGRSAESVFDEIVYLADQGQRFFAFLDDLTTLLRARMLRICELLQGAGLEITWGVESRADTLTAEMAQAMHAAGCRGVHFGVESGNAETLRRIGKRIDPEAVRRSVAIASRAGLHPVCSFIVGHPGETRADVRRTFDFAEELHREHGATCLFSSLTPFPGTDLFLRQQDFGIRLHAASFSDFTLLEPILSTADLTLDDMRELMAEARALEARTSIVRERLSRLGKEHAHA